MTSKIMRDNPLFMRNNFEATGKWGLPLIQKQSLPTDNIALVACSDTRNNDNKENKQKGVHFFVFGFHFADDIFLSVLCLAQCHEGILSFG